MLILISQKKLPRHPTFKLNITLMSACDRPVHTPGHKTVTWCVFKEEQILFESLKLRQRLQFICYKITITNCRNPSLCQGSMTSDRPLKTRRLHIWLKLAILINWLTHILTIFNIQSIEPVPQRY